MAWVAGVYGIGPECAAEIGVKAPAVYFNPSVAHFRSPHLPYRDGKGR